MNRVFVLAFAAGLLIGSSAPASAQGVPEVRTVRLAPGWIGISFGEPEPSGAVVVLDVMPDTPAAEAAIRQGDRIVLWEGRTDIEAAIAENPLQPGDTIDLTVEREGGVSHNLTLVAERRPLVIRPLRGERGDLERALDELTRSRRGVQDARDLMELQAQGLRVQVDSLQSRLRGVMRDTLRFRFGDLDRMEPLRIYVDSLGLAARDLSLGLVLAGGRGGVAGAELTDLNDGLASYFETGSGALVLRVGAETPAGRAGLEEGDVIVGAAGEEVATIADLRRIMSVERNRDLELEVVRRGSLQTLTLVR